RSANIIGDRGRHSSRTGARAIFSGRLSHVDTALEARPIGDEDPRGDEVALAGAARRDLDAILRAGIPVHLALNRDGLGMDLGLDLTRGADDQVVLLELDFPLDRAFDREVLTPRELAADEDRLSDFSDRFHHA